jgi:16S rRNA (uracil1498-N3)-methyltransferase
MNIVYIKKEEIGAKLSRGDRRSGHISRILKKRPGDTIAAGCSDNTLGRARIESLDDEGLVLSYLAEREAPELRPMRLLMGFPRPIQAGRVLKDLGSMGIASIWFALSDLGEKSYAESSFFKNREFESSLIDGAEQAGNPRLPEIRLFWSVDKACEALKRSEGGVGSRFLFHPDVALPSLAGSAAFELPVTIAIGSERGWTPRELELLGGFAFSPRYLGDRILKAETAALAASAIILSKLGYM